MFQPAVLHMLRVKREFIKTDCPICGKAGKENRRVDLKRQCPWTIMAFMSCGCGERWRTYIRDRSRETPFDIIEED
ncbi:hypothetical protein H1230_20600 [Paenibacillus sp. 19GGS1-52]|uniref:hypothetical protein n=1 Tax=Paenibacillus sp. 19GGS1-52 TaxID=2758563 RepID=UPI001EFA7BEF|nr:hypothetical protein [Paenibacillus sp. 19GGS1-52]ULO05471.1 hypothetical protein H1230_20600 [Paenibacillus sp. 19GGS1-52]